MTSEHSRILRFDFPVIPILGSLLLLLIWSNDSRLVWFILNEQGKPEVSVVATTVIFLGTAGLFTSQLISFALFDQFFNVRHKLLKSPSKKFNDTTEEWFNHLCKQLSPIPRENSRDGKHQQDNRRQLEHLSQGQIHAAIHSLEINCREDNPELASQIEQFYSMYVTFSIVGLVSICFVLLYFGHYFTELTGVNLPPDVNITSTSAVIDILIGLSCFSAAVHARRFKEHLRLKLLNSSRLKAIDLLSKWYQVELPKSRQEQELITECNETNA